MHHVNHMKCCDLMTTCCDLMTTCCDLMVTCCDLMATCCDLMVTCCDLMATCCDLMVTCCDLMATCCDLIASLKEAKQQYFDRIFTAYRTDLKKTWRTVSETLCRNKKNIVIYHLVSFMMEKNYLSRKQLQMPLMYILPILAKI